MTVSPSAFVLMALNPAFVEPFSHFLDRVGPAGRGIDEHIHGEEGSGNRMGTVLFEQKLMDDNPTLRAQCVARLPDERQAFINRE